jgi:hypothetical protein
VESVIGEPQSPAALDLLELLEFAWHDTDGEITPPDDVIVNILICSRGDLATMIAAVRLAIEDWRDLQRWAEDPASRAVPRDGRRRPPSAGEAARRAARLPLVESVLGKQHAPAGLDLLEVLDYYWHDVGEKRASFDGTIADILTCSRGDLAMMIRAAYTDTRDLRLWAQDVRAEGNPS